MRIYNTMARGEEPFVPSVPGEARMYTCGPTVYNYAHIGNYRAYIFEDLLRRALKFHGHRVTQVMNLTDVDDKTIRGARAAGLPLREFTETYKKAFFADLETLNIERAEHYPAATDHIAGMIAIVESLLAKGIAYQADDGSVYFSIAKFPEYGRLARIDAGNQLAGARVGMDEYAKDAVADFALWKAWDEDDGEVFWESPWGRGRPGWHIECSAMSMKYLGESFDIHTGGVDNMFPHHENEIAQSRAATGGAYARYWMHCAHLIVDGEKMSKSLGNFLTLRDVFEKGHNGREVRWVLLGTHYRKQLNFTWEACESAKSALRKFDDLVLRLGAAAAESAAAPDESLAAALANYRQAFGDALADDLNISEALAAVFAAERELNRRLDGVGLDAVSAAAGLDLFRGFDRVMGVFDVDARLAAAAPPAAALALAEERQAARKNRDFRAADELRGRLLAMGWLVEDTPAGPRLKPR